MYRIRYALIPVLLCFVASSRAALVYNTDFNMISFLDGATGDGGGMNASTLQIFSGFAEFQLSDTAESFPGFAVPPGYTAAYGRAHQTELKASVRLEGASIRRQIARATTYDVVTITDPAVAPGTPGTMIVGLVWGGSATVLDVFGAGRVSTEFAVGNLAVIKHNNLLSAPTVIDSSLIALGHGDSQNKGFAASVPFNYGQPFGLRFDLSVTAQNDWTCSFAIGGLHCSGGTLDIVEADFANTARLTSIILPAGATFAATSDTDYTPFIGAAIIPVPPAYLLLLSALVLLRRGLRIQARGRTRSGC